MRNSVAMWLVLLAMAAATLVAGVCTTVSATIVAVVLTGLALAGTLRQATWGITAAKAFSWLALALFFAFAVGDPEEPQGASPAELFLHRPATLLESSVGVALAVAPWLLCLHVLGLQTRALAKRLNDGSSRSA
jgi:hypothetical protein